MQNTSVLFKTLATSDARPIRGDVFISFSKLQEPTLQGIQDWDKYLYTDYSGRIVDVEWTREEQMYASVSSGMADIILDNHDGLFTPNGSSVLSIYMLPARPVKIYSGFGSEVVQSFVGLTDGMPSVNEKSKIVILHAIDFLSYFLKKPLDESSMFIDKRTDEILRTLFNDQGVLDVQMNLDVGLNRIPFVYAKKGEVLGDLVFKLMEAEGGRLFMDEDGAITFKNRQGYSSDVKMYLDSYRNIVNSVPKSNDELVNVVVVEGKIREVQSLQMYGQLTQPIQILHGQSVPIWISFQEPVTSAVDPVYVTSKKTSYYEVNTLQDGSGVASSSVVLSSSYLFDTSLQLVFTNNGSADLWVTSVVIFATPAVPVQDIYIREEDSSSVDKYGEKILSINNDFFGDVDNAQSKALIILHTFTDVGEIKQLEIKGDMTLQLGDAVRIDLNGVIEVFRVIKIINRIGLPGKFTQIVTVGKLLDNSNYFTIGVSAVGGTDMIAP